MSNSLWLCGLQHARLPCPSPIAGSCSNSVHRVGDDNQPSHPLSSPSPPALNLSQHQGLFKWVIRWPSIRALALASVLWMNIQGWFPLGLTYLILHSKGLLQHHSSKAAVHQCLAFFMVQLSHPYMTTGKTIALTIWTFVGNVSFIICCLGFS